MAQTSASNGSDSYRRRRYRNFCHAGYNPHQDQFRDWYPAFSRMEAVLAIFWCLDHP